MSDATKFILSLPPGLSVQEVVAKAKARGIEVTAGNVYRVRRLPAAAKPATKMPARQSTRPASPAKPTELSKSEFIRSIPPSTPGKVVVAQARAAGIELDVHYVYKIRTADGNRRAAAATSGPGAATSVSSDVDAAPEGPGSAARAPRSPMTATTAVPDAVGTPSRPALAASPQPIGDFERTLAFLDETDSTIRALYAELAGEPDLAPRFEASLRDLHAQRSDLARQAGMAALRERRGLRAAHDASPPPPAQSSEPSSPESTSLPPPVSEPETASAPPSSVPSPPPSDDPTDATPPAPVSAQQLADFIAGLKTPAAPPRVAARPDDRTALLALAAHVNIAAEVTTAAAFEAEAEQIERASSEDRQRRWREMTREGQVRWLSVLVAWAKALEQDALRFHEATLGVSAVFRELRTFSRLDAPGFVHGFARSASPRSATWREDALRLLREIRPEPVRAATLVKASAKATAPLPEDDESTDLEPLADWPYLDRVKDLRVVLLGGEVREERRVALERAFGFKSLEWIPRNRPRQVASLAERAAKGTVDFILVTKFVAHKETEAVGRSTKVPLLTMRHGYGVTTVRQVLEEHFARADQRSP